MEVLLAKKLLEKYRSDPQGIRETYAPKRDSQSERGSPAPPGFTNDIITNCGAKLSNGQIAPVSIRP
jgi:hypothetical protein